MRFTRAGTLPSVAVLAKEQAAAPTAGALGAVAAAAAAAAAESVVCFSPMLFAGRENVAPRAPSSSSNPEGGSKAEASVS